METVKISTKGTPTRRLILPCSLMSRLKVTDLKDHVRTALEQVYRGLIEAEAASMVRAHPRQHINVRTIYRNGSPPRLLTVDQGDLELRISKLRQGSLFPDLLEGRRRVSEAL